MQNISKYKTSKGFVFWLPTVSYITLGLMDHVSTKLELLFTIRNGQKSFRLILLNIPKNHTYL